jgi:protein-tyrosine phosphatase
VRQRTLRWDGCQNVRDLGGLPTGNGGTTKFGRVVRSDNVCKLTESGRKAVVEYGVRRIVDLRWSPEIEDDGPSGLLIDVVHVELLGLRDGAVAEIDAQVRDIDDPVARRSGAYRGYLERFASNFAAAVGAVATAPDGPMLVHCAGGVDRTGLVSALLLRLAGVELADIGADYAESERNWAPHVRSWIDAAPDDAERRHRRMLALCPPQAIVTVLEELEHRHGTIAEYLLAAGATEPDLERARARLRD